MHTRSALVLLTLCSACGASPAPDGLRSSEVAAGGEEQCTEPAAPASLQGEIRTLASAERRAAPPGTATVALLAQGHNAFVGRLEMDAGAAVPEHRDRDEEYIVILEGGGTITIEGVERSVGAGDTIFMPADARVSFQNGQERLVALQVFAGPASAAKYDRWTPVEAP